MSKEILFNNAGANFLWQKPIERNHSTNKERLLYLMAKSIKPTSSKLNGCEGGRQAGIIHHTSDCNHDFTPRDFSQVVSSRIIP